MIKGHYEIKPKIIPFVEDILYELAPSKWSIFQSTNNENGILVGFFDTKNELLTESVIFDRVSNLDLNLENNIIFEELIDEDWKNAYKKHFKAWSVDNFHCIPQWEKDSYEIPLGEIGIYLDPGMAFGTGNHETTKLCMEEIVFLQKKIPSSEKKKISVLDIGCGSGILSITASLLGFSQVEGIDCDSDAVRISMENAKLNDVNDIKFNKHSLDQYFPLKSFGLIVANLQTSVLSASSAAIMNLLSENGILILSGILAEEGDALIEHYKQYIRPNSGFFQKKVSNQWCMIKCTRIPDNILKN